MHVGALIVDLYLPGCTSLKGKRSIVKSIKERVKNKFNVSVAEVDYHDLHQRALIGVAMIGNDAKKINSALDKVLSFLELFRDADLAGHQLEIM
ncbi:MAG: DUF503 domain-containing protein [Deltaproteobacteria bacterium]|nr:DUF503 domain-containing protein [Deltaproteobacteria bacterium]